MDRLVLAPLKLRCLLGVSPRERRHKQTIEVMVAVEFLAHKAGVSDRLEDTVNYPDIADEVARFVRGSRYHLLEALAENLSKSLLLKFKLIHAVDLRVAKNTF